MEKEVKEYSKFSNRDLRKVTVLKNSQLTDKLPSQFGEIKIQYLDNSELVQKFKLNHRDINKTRDKSYSEKGGILTRKKLMHNWALEGGGHAEIGFDSNDGKFVIKKVELWGI